MRTRGRVAGVCAAAGVALAGCGTASTGGSSAVTATGARLTIYASQPPGPASAAATDTIEAEKLALQQAGGQAGNFKLRLVVLHGSELSANARTAIQDKSTIAYLGELVPGTSPVSVEILNQQGVLEVSPADTAAYLTQSVSTAANSPTKFYPAHTTYSETFARVVPTTVQEAKAIVAQIQAEHATSVYAADDGTQYGNTIAEEVRQAAHTAGLSASGSAASAGAVFYGGSVDSPADRSAAVRFVDQAATASPKALLFVPSGLGAPSFVGSLSSSARARLRVSSPGFLASDLSQAGKSFVTSFKSAYGHTPAPQAIFGYEAMAAVLAGLKQAGANANRRATVVSDVRSEKRTGSVLGDYSLSNGDPSIGPFVFSRMRGGQLTPFSFAAESG
jgi:branched-chain amino acid transport system substrate-binding protein